jgi:Flp pilus assembly pilin Flp
MWMRRFSQLLRDRRGLSTVEYTVLLVLIVTGAISVWQNFGAALTAKVQGGADTISGLEAKPPESN